MSMNTLRDDISETAGVPLRAWRIRPWYSVGIRPTTVLEIER